MKRENSINVFIRFDGIQFVFTIYYIVYSNNNDNKVLCKFNHQNSQNDFLEYFVQMYKQICVNKSL